MVTATIRMKTKWVINWWMVPYNLISGPLKSLKFSNFNFKSHKFDQVFWSTTNLINGLKMVNLIFVNLIYQFDLWSKPCDICAKQWTNIKRVCSCCDCDCGCCDDCCCCCGWMFKPSGMKEVARELWWREWNWQHVSSKWNGNDDGYGKWMCDDLMFWKHQQWNPP